MKNGWQTKRLGEVCEMYQPKTITGKDLVENGQFLVYGANGVIGRYNKFNHEKSQLLITCRGATCGTVNVSAPRSWITGNAMVVRAKDTTLEMRFLEYLFRGGIDLSKAITGAAQPQITRTNLEPLQICYPNSTTEQKRIVEKLDEAFVGLAKAKENAEKNLQNARALFKSHLEAIFSQRGNGWVEKRLEEIGKTQTGSTPSTSDQSNYGDFISFVKPGDFNTDGTLDYNKDGLSKRGADGARIVPAGSVLMVCIGATIGKCGYCDQDVTTNQQVNALTPCDGSSNRFIYYQMLTETFQHKVILASGQATLPIINKSKWSALSVWLTPQATEQKSIAAKLDAILAETQRLARIYEQKLEALESLKKSILHEAFSGNL